MITGSMKKTLLLLLIALAILHAALAQQAGIRPAGVLAGKITDSTTGLPLSQCSIFINKTSKGTTSRADGSFSLANVPGGRSELIVSAIGYTTYVREITGSRLPAFLQVRLQQKSTELSAFTVEPYVKDGWQQYGQIFLDNFIGTTPNASSCRIRNKEVLRFHYSPKSRRLSVTASEPLIIENKALGYDLQYQLERFTLSYDTHTVLFMGYPFFREMAGGEGRKVRWVLRRIEAYKGSLRQFIRSLYDDRLVREGFSMQMAGKFPNEEKQRVKKVYNPSAPEGSYPMDSLHYYWNTLREPDYITRIMRVEAGDLVTADSNGVKSFFLEGPLTVDYLNLKLRIEDRRSILTMIIPTPVYIEADGGFYPGEAILASGIWGLREKIANMVPDDYELPIITPPTTP